MRITVLTVGSRGDVQPYVALGLGLRAAGHEVRLATHHEFEPLVRGHGLGFAPVEGSPRRLLEGDAGKAWLESGANPLRFVRRMVRVGRPLLARVLTDSWSACQGAQAIVFAAFGFAGYHVAEKLGVPCVSTYLQPFTPTRAFPSLLAPPCPRLGGAYNLATHKVVEQLLWHAYRGVLNRWRVEALGLAPIPFGGPYRRLAHERLPTVYGFSPSVVPPPPDWPRWVRVAGYWFLDRPADWAPPDGLEAFLADGPPPVYVGFGSMTVRDARATTRVALEALRLSGQRGVLLRGWAGLGQADVPADVRVVDAVPHEWLFPRCAAVVHHGGAGTTAAGLRAGVPTVTTPFFADQPFWGRRVADLGVGPRPVPRGRLSAETLAGAIGAAVGDPGIRARAAALGERIGAEEGVGCAIELVERGIGAVGYR